MYHDSNLYSDMFLLLHGSTHPSVSWLVSFCIWMLSLLISSHCVNTGLKKAKPVPCVTNQDSTINQISCIVNPCCLYYTTYFHCLSFISIKMKLEIQPFERPEPLFTTWLMLCGCWWPGNVRNQVISSSDSDIVHTEYSEYQHQKG